ncbi:LAME_0B01376g1_1 [Lachancea meyersii CBS 8951]|uniref:LAME_0B01376g1_1 n=1 Tax=Lachancea meyersii CBS 8951 TaxID=1266667 RepID=A0A1G4IT33_9SACH|nr:LAME_0B01376g1_1 [Lachancea meyersii CBS 8951]
MDGSGTMTMSTATNSGNGGGLAKNCSAGPGTGGSASFEDWLFPETGDARLAGEYESMASAGAGAGAPWGATSSCTNAVTDSSTATSSAGSPLDQFSTLFDSGVGPAGGLAAGDNGVGSGADSDALVTASNSVSGSPSFVKREDAAGVCGAQQLPLATLDGFADLEQAVGLGNESANNGNAPGNAGNHAGSLAAAAARKRRAPRKRLTAHQKEAHNKIEKRYRININTKISKLQQIIPWVASEETAFEVGEGKAGGAAGAASATGSSSSCNSGSEATCCSSDAATAVAVRLTDAATPKLNKSMILEKAVDYILYLQNNERLYEMEVQRLKRELERERSK